MTRNPASRHSVGQLIAQLLILALARIALAGQVDHADKLIEAHEYRLQAEHVLNSQCSLPKAEDWAKRALNTARSYRTTDQRLREDAGEFISQVTILLADVREREKLEEQLLKKTQTFISQGRLQSATALLRQSSPPNCDTRFATMRSEIARRHDIAKRTVAEGDAILPRAPRQAIRLYRVATRSDSEFPGLSERIRYAREVGRMRGIVWR